jgi:hypothetical protein
LRDLAGQGVRSDAALWNEMETGAGCWAPPERNYEVTDDL